MPNIDYPTAKQITAIQAEGYTLEACENVGVSDMQSCEPGKYKNPELMMIEEDTKTAILFYL